MKTLKSCIFMCIVLAFFYCNANAQKPIVENPGIISWEIEPSPDLPCLTEKISGNIPYDGFFTNSSLGGEVYNWNYHEKAAGILTGPTTGEYQISWTYNEKGISFDVGSQKHSRGMAHTNITKNGKLFMTINWQFNYIFNENGNPIVVHDVYNPKCK